MKLSDFAEEIARVFSLSDLRGLCFQLDIDFDELSGHSKKEIIIDLINYCKHRGRLEELVAQCQKLRPKGTWHSENSWDKTKLYTPHSPIQSILRVWILGAIVFTILMFGLVKFVRLLPALGATPTKIAEATIPPTQTVTLTPTKVSADEPSSFPRSPILGLVPSETPTQIPLSNTSVPNETQISPTNTLILPTTTNSLSPTLLLSVDFERGFEHWNKDWIMYGPSFEAVQPGYNSMQAVQVNHSPQDGPNSNAHLRMTDIHFRGGFAYQVIVWCKADEEELCTIWLGDAPVIADDPDPTYEHATDKMRQSGNGEWQQISVCLDLPEDDHLAVFMYAEAEGSQVIYDNVVIEEITICPK